MIWFRRKKASGGEIAGGPASRSEALAYRPVKNREVREEDGENGEVLLTYALSLTPWLVKLALRLGLQSRRSLRRRLQLDELGSLTWSLVDGKRTVRDIAELVCRRYKLNRREAEVAMSGFFRDLGRRGLIGFLPPHGEEGKKST